jgi:hypothetical protein
MAMQRNLQENDKTNTLHENARKDNWMLRTITKLNKNERPRHSSSG